MSSDIVQNRMPFISIYPNVDRKVKAMGRNLFYPRQAFSKIQINTTLKTDCDITFHAGYDLSVTVPSEKVNKSFTAQTKEQDDHNGTIWTDIPFFDPECHPDFPKALKNQLLAISTNDMNIQCYNIRFVNEYNNISHTSKSCATNIRSTITFPCFSEKDRQFKIILHPCIQEEEKRQQQHKERFSTNTRLPTYADVVRGIAKAVAVQNINRQPKSPKPRKAQAYNIFVIRNMMGGLLHFPFMPKEKCEAELNRNNM